MNEIFIESLTKHKLFKGLTNNKILQMFSEIKYNLKSYEQNDLVFLYNDKCNDLVILLDGCLRCEIYKPNGSSVVIEVHKAPATIAPAFLFGIKRCFPVNVVSVNKSTIMFISRKVFLEIIFTESKVLQNYLDLICTKTQILSEKLRFHSVFNLRQKIIYYLINNCDLKDGKSVKLSVTLKELSEILGVERPSISRAIKQLCNEGLISYSSKQIRILNLIELKRDLE